eukprot:2351884-Amphidinium_carterae.1
MLWGGTESAITMRWKRQIATTWLVGTLNGGAAEGCVPIVRTKAADEVFYAGVRADEAYHMISGSAIYEQDPESVLSAAVAVATTIVQGCEHKHEGVAVDKSASLRVHSETL